MQTLPWDQGLGGAKHPSDHLHELSGKFKTTTRTTATRRRKRTKVRTKTINMGIINIKVGLFSHRIRRKHTEEELQVVGSGPLSRLENVSDPGISSKNRKNKKHMKKRKGQKTTRTRTRTSIKVLINNVSK